MLMQLTGGSQERSAGPAPVAATPLTPSNRALATPSQPPPVPNSVALISPTIDSTVAAAFAVKRRSCVMSCASTMYRSLRPMWPQ